MNDEEEKKETEGKATEEGTAEEKKTPVDDSADGVSKNTTPLIDIANQAAKRMEDANRETARLQDVQAERDQRIALGGVTEAGQEPKKEEISNEDYAKEVLEGKLNDKE